MLLNYYLILFIKKLIYISLIKIIFYIYLKILLQFKLLIF